MGYKPLVIPLGRGLDQAAVKNFVENPQGLRVGKNLDFGLRGGLTGRPGAVRQTGYLQRQLDGAGLISMSSVNTLAETGYTNPYLVTARDGTSTERPGLVTRGRLYTREGSLWTDRLGICQARSARLCELMEIGGIPDAATGTSGPYIATNRAGCASYNFGPCQNGVTGTTATTIALLTDSGSVKEVDTLSAAATCGTGARCGSVSALVHNPAGTNNLRIVLYNSSTDTRSDVLLATNALASTGTGDAPVVCCDFDQTKFFIAYWTTTPGQIKLIRVTTAGVIEATYTLGLGAVTNQRCLWITNTTVATDRIVLVFSCDTFTVSSQIIQASTMTKVVGLDLTQAAGQFFANSGQVVTGVAENGQAWICWTNNAGELWLSKRSLTAATEIGARKWVFAPPPSLTVASADSEAAVVYIQHQPIKVGGRTLFGISTVKHTGTAARGPGATWLVQDITNLWFTTAADSDQMRDPVAVAKGEVFRSATPWGPVSAILPSNGASSYRFSTVDWSSLKYVHPDNSVPPASTGSSGTFIGERGLLGLNEITLDKFQAASFKESTIIAGSCPRAFSRGNTYPIGFPWLEAPTLTVTAHNVGGGTFAAGDHTFQAIFSHVDDAGQRHVSEPSFPVTVTALAGTMVSFTIGVPHFNERESGTVTIELYATDANGTVKTFRKRYSYPGTSTASVGETNLIAFDITDGEPLYTEGQVFEAQVPNASGGIAVAGRRCWVSDGRHLFASRLGPSETNKEAPSWFIDNNLTVDVPPSAGLVLGLASLNQRILAFCERGVYVTGGEGPDDTGKGPDFLELDRISALGVAHARAIIATPKGIFFQSANTQADGRLGTGGLWLIDPSGGCNIVGTRVQEELSTTIYDGCYLPEREQIVFSGAQASNKVLVFDLRAEQWAVWDAASGSGDTLGNTFCASAGLLWSCGSEVMKFTGTTGQDTGSSTADITQRLELGNINIAGATRWGRIKSMTVLGDFTTQYTLNQTIKLDDAISASADPISVNDTTVTTWPTAMHAPEWRVPQEKCSVAYITLTATPAVATWTALELEVMTQGKLRPSFDRQ